MTTITATIQGRRLELDVPADWPDGTEVETHPLSQSTNGDTDTMSHDEIARTLAAMDQVAPFDLTAVEQAAWEAERKARKDREKADFMKHADELRRQWE